MLSEELLKELDATEEVKHQGRSAVLRQAAAEYLKRRQQEEIEQRYQRAYETEGGLGEEFAGWETQGTFPVE